MISIIATALCIAASNGLIGSWLVIQGESLLSDAISHALLSGIVLMYLATGLFYFPVLLLGGFIAAICAVGMIYACSKLLRITLDVAIGLVFPIFFSLGVVLICLYAHNVHLDIDMVLLGDLVFVPFDRLNVYGIDCGPKSIWLSFVMLIVTIVSLYYYHRRWLVLAYDQDYARTIGVRLFPMSIAKLLIVTSSLMVSFEYVGIVGAIGMLVIPAATAILQATSMNNVVVCAFTYALLGTSLGLACGFWADVSLAGAVLLGQVSVFCIVLVLPRVFCVFV